MKLTPCPTKDLIIKKRSLFCLNMVTGSVCVALSIPYSIACRLMFFFLMEAPGNISQIIKSGNVYHVTTLNYLFRPHFARCSGPLPAGKLENLGRYKLRKIAKVHHKFWSLFGYAQSYVKALRYHILCCFNHINILHTGALKQLQPGPILISHSAPFCTQETDTQCRTHSEHSDERPLQQPHQNVTPVVFVVRHTSVSHVQRKGHQEELDGWSHQSRPLPLHPGLDVELYTQTTQSSH